MERFSRSLAAKVKIALCLAAYLSIIPSTPIAAELKTVAADSASVDPETETRWGSAAISLAGMVYLAAALRR